ncbi:MAG: hypothetical protein ACJA1A_001806 [Saprospiraceae bacterium]|jgi:hypothetical protein|tara:strand:- start:822 stop:1226 length:405 start_codon:yes stop_codon:yes gene_type:complete
MCKLEELTRTEIVMSENIVLKKSPKIEFQLLDNGFQLVDEQTELNSGFYSYSDLRSIELNKTWYPRLAKWLRIITWILNGVPYFPDAESCKKAKVIMHFRKIKLGMWLTDSYMADKAKILKVLLDEKTKLNTSI